MRGREGGGGEDEREGRRGGEDEREGRRGRGG